MTQQQAYKRLLAIGGHAFTSAKIAKEITEPFGFECQTYLAKANPHEYKGLSLWDENGNAVSQMEGQEALSIAEQIYNHLGLEGAGDFFGRGKQFYSYMEQIAKHLGTGKAERAILDLHEEV